MTTGRKHAAADDVANMTIMMIKITMIKIMMIKIMMIKIMVTEDDGDEDDNYNDDDELYWAELKTRTSMKERLRD